MFVGWLVVEGFNSRAREGRDPAEVPLRHHLLKFQLTRPRGARRPRNDFQPSLICFNSRAREGRDCHSMISSRCIEVSTHAPARGATDDDHGI